MEETIDYTTDEGASLIAAQVQRYWHERGYFNVEAFVSDAVRSGRQSFSSVRSNLVNGLPPVLP